MMPVGTSFKFPNWLNKQLTLIMIDFIPNIILSDGHGFIEAVFTKDAINRYRKEYCQHKFTSLRDKPIIVYKWGLQIDYCDSR